MIALCKHVRVDVRRSSVADTGTEALCRDCGTNFTSRISWFDAAAARHAGREVVLSRELDRWTGHPIQPREGFTEAWEFGLTGEPS